MRSITIILGILCAFLFGALGSQTGFTYATTLPFLLSLSVVAYAGLSGPRVGEPGPRVGEPITFDRMTQF